MTRITTTVLLISILLPGCAVPTYNRITAAWDDDEETATIGDASTTDDAESTMGGPISTVTTATISSGDESEAGTDATDTAGDTESTATGDVDAPPAISDHALEPPIIKVSGAIDVKIWIDGGPGLAQGVRMSLEDGSEAELTLNPDTQAFEGEILALSGFQNSDDYVATFTPWRGDLEGESIELPYAIELHEPGDEDLWDLDKSGGSGQVSAIDVLYGGNVVEMLTLVGDGTSKCVLRQRDDLGVVVDVIDILPGGKCRAVDLEVDDEDGTIYLLQEGWTNAGWMWWLAKAPYFGATLKTVKTGEVGEEAHALAVSSTGTMAVCGSRETPEPEDLSDAVVHIIRPDFSSYAKEFDYDQDGLNHKFDERARGCEFDPSDADRLIIVGEVFGKVDDWNVKINRRFDVLYDVETDDGDLRVASAGLEVHSFAVDVAFAEDQTFILGSVCGDDACTQGEGKMWALDGDGDLASTRSLGLYSNKALHPSRIRTSPAGYLVVTSGGLAGADEAFLVRAYDPFKAEPLFAYIRQDAGLLHLAHALAIGPYGQVYAGGFGANGYPLFVIIYG